MSPQVTLAGRPVCDCGGLLISPYSDVGRKWGMTSKLSKAIAIARRYEAEYACASCLKPVGGEV